MRIPQRTEALVVGGGPAGLFAALSLGRAGIRTVLVDRGPDIERRAREVAEGHGDYESGIGGAGLFSDGKLCMSLDVGGHLDGALTLRDRRDTLAVVESLFSELFRSAGLTPIASTPPAQELYAAAASAGLGFKYYPVLQIGTEQCADVVVALRKAVAEAGVTIIPNVTLAGLHVEGDDKVAVLEHADGRRARLRAPNVVLALGKVGAAQEALLCRRLGVETHGQAMYIGLRYECPTDVLAPLFGTSKDPKYSLQFADGSKIKTHCASRGGQVLRLEYEGLPLAGGHNYTTARTALSGFSVLWDGFRTSSKSYAAARQVMRETARRADGRLVVEAAASVLGEPSQPAALDARSCLESRLGSVRELLPAEYFVRLDDFMSRLEVLALGVRSEGWFYAPAIEWWMERVAVDTGMETSVRGLFACGDGSGWSQGIVHAAATGLLAAGSISQRVGRLHVAA